MNIYQEDTCTGAYNLNYYRCGMRNVRILHICSYYIGNKLYKNLIGNLSTRQVKQIVYIPIKSKKLIGKNQLSSDFKSVKYHYSNLLNKLDRIFYKTKIHKQLKDIEEKVVSKNMPEIIHAHTIFSDGGTAYLLNKKYGIKYIVNVRNTDINFFFKYAIHLRAYMYKILLNSHSIVCISYAYKHQLSSLLPSHILSKVEGKIQVIPNGIENYWHENTHVSKKNINNNKVNLIFMGTLNKNKNLKSVINTCKELQNDGIKVLLNVIGDGPLEMEYKKLVNELNLKENVKFYGHLNNKNDISKIMDKSDIFIMPSFTESFGIAYIEAMSRGLPVIYSKGQGIYGFFEQGEVGYGVNPNKIVTIIVAIKKILNNYNEISFNCQRLSKTFNWTSLSDKYLKIYQDL